MGSWVESPSSSTAPPYEGPRRQFSEEELSVTYQPPGYPNFLIGPRNSVRESGVLAFCMQSLEPMEVNHLNLGLSEPMSCKYFSRIFLENVLDQTDRGRSCDRFVRYVLIFKPKSWILLVHAEKRYISQIC